MAIIEGFGDEVTIVAAVMVILTLIATILYARDFTPGNFNIFWLWFFQQRENQATSTTGASSPAAPREQVENSSSELNASVNENGELRHNNVPNEFNTTVSSTSHAEIGGVEVQNNVSSEAFEGGSSSCQQPSTCEVEEHSSVETEDEDPAPLNTIRVRLKYLNDTERTVTTKLIETIGNFKRCHFSEELSNNKTVRLIFSGQLLRNEATLESCGIVDGTVVHVHISQTQNVQSTPLSSSSDLDLSCLLWPLFSVILGICWVMYVRYPEFFNVPSIILLIAFSVSFLVVYVHQQVQLS